MPHKVILGDREVEVCSNIPELMSRFSLHLEYGRHRGKRPCKIKVSGLEPWRQVFGVECVSCEDHPTGFFLIASGENERRKIFAMLEQVRLSYIAGPMNAWERLLDDEVV